jgi:RluA family pseudouridine synthase
VNILFEDDQILVVYKPAGLPVLPDGWEKDAPYLIKLLEEKYPKIWIVHRLDKVTSGVMVLAKSAKAHRDLNIQFEQHGVEKIYHAIANGSPAWEETVARQPLRINVGHNHRTVATATDGKPSETRFRILDRYATHVLLEAKPVTGRTHQVRVHSSALGHPLLADVLYGAPKSEILDRPALHAQSLTLAHPTTQERMTFTAAYPPDFVRALEIIRARK